MLLLHVGSVTHFTSTFICPFGLHQDRYVLLCSFYHSIASRLNNNNVILPSSSKWHWAEGPLWKSEAFKCHGLLRISMQCSAAVAFVVCMTRAIKGNMTRSFLDAMSDKIPFYLLLLCVQKWKIRNSIKLLDGLPSSSCSVL